MLDTRSIRRSLLTVTALLAAAGCGLDIQEAGSNAEAVSAAAFTSFDATGGGCIDSPNGVNCNHYTSKDRVFINGGPAKARLADGSYFFAVLLPGTQHGGFMEGARGNLSDTAAGGSAGDTGSGDPVANRTFTIVNGAVNYVGTHARGTSPNGHSLIQLAPFDTSSNDGGTYMVAICKTGAVSPSDCKFDAFHVDGAAGGVDAGAPANTPDAGSEPSDAGPTDAPPSIMPDVPAPPAVDAGPNTCSQLGGTCQTNADCCGGGSTTWCSTGVCVRVPG